MSLPRRRHIALVATVAWLALVVVGLGALLRYSNSPGREGLPPSVWPSSARVEPGPNVHTLVVVAHPKCPCTRATVSELARIMAQCRGRLVARVVFVLPDGLNERWARTDLWRSADAIPGVTVALDRGGEEARRFGSLTSGQAALYDPAGRLVFRGGITAARGHEGANAGRSAVVSLVEGGRPAQAQTPVFGCPLDRDAGELEDCPGTAS